MTHSYGDTNRERQGTSSVVSETVHWRKKHQYQYKGDEYFNPKSLASIDSILQGGSTKRAYVYILIRKSLEKSCCGDGASYLSNDIEKGPDQSDLTSYQKAESNCWIDVSTTDVPDCPLSRGDTKAKT